MVRPASPYSKVLREPLVHLADAVRRDV
jgi:hypothetical protein